MIRVKISLAHRRIRCLIWLVLTVFVLLGYSLQSVAGSAYYSMLMQNYATVSSPPVELQEGTAGNSTIYTNNTSAKVSVEENNTLELWVDGFDNSSVEWDEIGSTPYLSSINYPTDYITTDIDAKEEKFDFANTSATGTINDVKICVYARQNATHNGQMEIHIYNSTGPQRITTITPNNSAWTWNNFSCLTALSTWAEVNNAKLRLTADRIGGADIQYVDAALLSVNYTSYSFDYVLRVNNTATTDSWEIRLKKYSNSSIGRLQNCTIYFRNATNANSTQIVIENGSFNQTEGPWYNLDNSETIYIAMTVEANSTGTSYVYTYLEIRTPNTTTYAQYVITFKIT